jgi:hypothetical protein
MQHLGRRTCQQRQPFLEDSDLDEYAVLENIEYPKTGIEEWNEMLPAIS